MQEDETTTSEQTVDEGGQEPVPNEQPTQEADSSEATTESGGEAPVPETEDKLQSFAKGQGIESIEELSEREQKLLKVAYDNNAEYQRNRQKATELEKASKITDEQMPADATPEQRDNARLRNMELKFDIQQWKLDNPQKLEHEEQMVEVLQDETKRALVQGGYLSLDEVYSLARASNLDSVKNDTRKETLKNLANQQKAAVPRGNATTSGVSSNKITKQNVDQLIAQNGQKWFQENYETINKVLAT